MSEGKVGGVSADQLKDILATVIAEARKPVLTEEDIRRIEAKKQEAADGAENERQRREAARANIRNCGHMKDFPWNNQPAAVYIKPVSGADPCSRDPLSGNFFLCQHCQARIHPGQPVEGMAFDSVRDIFDETEFNRLWRASRDARMIG